MARITNKQLTDAFEALQTAEREAEIERQLWDGTSYYTATADDLIFVEGNATYGNAYGIVYSPWHNPQSEHYRKDMSGHYEATLGLHTTSRSEALLKMRAYTAGVYAVLRAQRETARRIAEALS